MVMKPDDFTEQAQEIIALSQEIVQRYHHSQWDSEHIMMALVEQEQGVASDVFDLLGISQDRIKEKLHEFLLNAPKTADQTSQMFVSPRSSSLLNRAKTEAERMNDEFIGVEHLLVALVQEDSGAVNQIVEEFQLGIENIYKVLQQIRGGHRVTDPRAESRYGSLDKFSVDLTLLASQGKLDPVNGRDVEISRAMQTLIRRTKNNPVLIGGAGVGKTAVVEGLAQQIIAGNVPDELQNRRVLSLEMGSMLAGAKFRGEFEERLKAVMDEIKQASGEIILFIDEVHTVVGAGASEGAIDASNM
ncbi:MAG: Clp protease N-terminal domain-containing protein, partial [Chloroflexota bacterium]|nr:Clp protease N-terminal domain-containing protein [Chloroflexota bacterium]